MTATQDSISSVYLVAGDEYLVAAKAREIVNALVPAEDQAFGLEIVDGAADTVDAARKAVESCIGAVQTPGFLGSRKVVWFRDVSFLSETVVGRSENVKPRVNDLAALVKGGLLPGQVLVISCAKVDKRFALYKACKDVGELHEFAVPDKGYRLEQHAGAVANAAFEKFGLTAEESARQRFLQKVGTDTRQIMNEAEKLSVYLGDRTTVKAEDVEAISCASRSAVAWDLTDAFGERNLPLALNVLRQLLFQKENAIGLISALESRVRELSYYREALDAGWLYRKRKGRGYAWGAVPPEVEEVFTEVFARDPRKTHPFRIGILAEQAARFHPVELARCRRMLVSAHARLLSSSLPGPLLLELLLVSMLRRRTRKRRQTPSAAG